jgi:hypothetical protein
VSTARWARPNDIGCRPSFLAIRAPQHLDNSLAGIDAQFPKQVGRMQMTPFVLKVRTKLAPECEPSDQQTYDHDLQLWIDKKSGAPVVCALQTRIQQSEFGETTLTRTKEGVDQSETATLQASLFGETTMTKTIEGADQRELTGLAASQFGETLITATREGHDQSEMTDLGGLQFLEPTVARHGRNQTKAAVASPLSNSGNSGQQVLD